MAKKQKQDTALAEMLEVASDNDKSALILSLAICDLGSDQAG